MSLLSFDDALAMIAEHVHPLTATETVHLNDAQGRILAQEIRAADAYPRFDNSSVDGFALGSPPNGDFELADTIPAGGSSSMSLTPGTAARVFTGAPVPFGTFAVAMQEDVAVLGAKAIRVQGKASEGENIRRKGSEIQPQQLLLKPGTALDPGAIGILALCGQAQAEVTAEPKVAILSTGDELVPFDQHPQGSEIRETNGPMLRALFTAWRMPVLETTMVEDKRDALSSTLREVAGRAEIVVLSGGVSVGGKDFVPGVVQELGEVLFHGVAMRPGKPVLFGRIGQTLVFGLPGNPASSFVGCHTFVREAVRRLRGETKDPLRWVLARYGENHAPYSRDDFIRVVLSWRDGELWADPSFEQASFALRSMASCDGIARLPAGAHLRSGEACRVLLV